MKRLLVLLSFVCITSFKTYAYDFSAVCSTGQTLYYNITSDSTVTLVSPANGNWYPSGVLHIPDTVHYNNHVYSVTKIGESVFAGHYSLSMVVIGDNVTYIGANAFYSCRVNTVVMGGNVTYIGSNAFEQCGIRAITIPSSITTIESGTFRGCTGLTSVSIPDNVVSVGSQAFHGCTYLDTLYIGSNVTTIGDGAFGRCGHIRYLHYNAKNCQTHFMCFNSRYYWGNSIFSYTHNHDRYCTSLDSLNTLIIGDSVVNIMENTFGGQVIDTFNNYYYYTSMRHIRSITISENVRTIGLGALSGLYADTLYYNAKDCRQMRGRLTLPGAKIIVGNNVQRLPDSAFYGLQSSFDTIHLPDSIRNVGSHCFDGVTSASGTLVIPSTIDTINDYAFANCSGLTSVEIPNSVTTIGESAFLNCTGLSSVMFNADSCTSAGSSSDRAFYGCSNINSFVFGNNVKVIPAYLCYDMNRLTSITIPDSVTSIGGYAFSGCSGLTSVTYNAINCTSAGTSSSQAFKDFLNIASVTIGNNVQSIPANLFSGCTGLTSVTIGNSVDTIGSSAFSNCTNLTTVNYTGTIAQWCQIGFSGSTANPVIYSNSLRINGSLVTNLVIPNGVTNIKSCTFYNCRSLTSLSIPNSVVGICTNAFANCSGLTSVEIPNSILWIDTNAFANCTGLDTVGFYAKNCIKMSGSVFAGCDNIRHIEIGEEVQRFPDSAFTVFSHLFDTIPWRDSLRYVGAWNFHDNNNLTGNCAIPQSVDTIADGAFYNCNNIISLNTNNVRYLGRNAFADCDRLMSVTLGDSTQTLGNGAFSGCFRLQNIDLGRVVSIGDSAFKGCVRLVSPELPAGLTTIGTRAFQGCSLLAGKLTFPATITRIGDYAYSNIGTVTGIDMLGSTPPTIYAHTFASVSNSRTVSVPCGAVMSYYTTDYWENFSNIMEAPPYKLTVQSNNTTMGSAAITQQPTCSNHSAIIQATALSGFHFLEWNDGNGTNPRTIQMTQDSTFTAVFVTNNSYIVVEPNDPTMGATSGTGTYGYNAPVTMTATAYSGYHFLRWNDGVTQNPRYLVATRDSSFTAIFVNNVSTITVANANPEMGNVSGSGVYYYQNLVSITATPNYGYHFSQWNDGITQNPRTITVSQDSAFTAYFALNTYNIVATSNSTTMGSVSGSGAYTYLHEMSMTATPAYGYHFVQWNDQVTDNPRTITVTRDSAFTAQFTANSYSITAEPNDPTMGSAYGSGTYNFHTTATLTAVATYGYHFTQWSDGVTDNPRTITVQNTATYTAMFAINSYILTVQSSNPAIGATSGGGNYNYLTPVNITAIPNAGYHFTQWSDGNTDNPRLVSVTQNATYIAQFAINSYAVGVTSNNTSMGSVNGSGTYNHGSSATLTATAYYGYHFVQWQDGNTDNPRNVVVTDSAQYTAEFTYNSYLVTANSSNVTLGNAIGGGSYNYLSQVALTAVPMPHYHFTLWNDSIVDNPRTVIVTRDTTFTAHFAIDRHTIGVNSADAVRGSVGGSDTVDYNTPVWISATANYGYHFTQWNDGNSSNPRRVVVSRDTVFTANFVPNQYAATCAVNDNTRGTVASTGGSYNYLTQLTFTAIPNTDYHFLRWSNGSTDNPITFTLTKDTVLTAILVGLTANVNDSTMGTVSHIKQSNLVEMVTATPNYGYHFVQWQDGNTDNPRTMNLVSDTSVTAVFAINTYVVSVVSNDSTLGSVLGGGGYNYLSQVTITATAAPHSHFVHWNDGNTTNPRLLTLTRDTSFTAIFESDLQYQIVVDANDSTMGSVSGSGMYYIGETATITATANDHYYFSQWSDGNTSNPRLVTVLGNATYTAVFEPVTYTVTVEANDYTMGQVIGSGSYAYGATVTIEARAFGGYRFAGWNDGVQDRQRTIAVISDTSFTATFDSNVGIDEVTNLSYGISIRDRHIIVEGVENDRVRIFDVTGRQHQPSEALPSGIYMVQIGNWSKKVLVL